MKKKGFSLAELMIAMGVVGVVAAITIPMLIQNAQKAQIGPKLAKAVSAFEQASLAMFADYEVSSYTEGGLDVSTLSNYLKITPYIFNATTSNTNVPGMTTFVKDKCYIAKDGIVYLYSNGKIDTTKPKNKRVIGTVFIDINGEAKPNTGGTDIFAFYWIDDGTLKPAGDPEFGVSWKSYCPVGGNPIVPTFCTGHIFANNLKVLYKQ